MLDSASRFRMPRSVFVTRSGGPDVLRVRDTPPRSPGPGEVRVAVAFAGVNFAELAQRAGLYRLAPKPPFVPGFEVSGTVSEVGAGVPGLRAGDAVLAVTRFGGYTTDLVVDAARARPLPPGMALEEAAAFPVVYLTAYHGITEVARMRPGESVLIHACAGGVGTALVQLAKAIGLVSYGTASTDQKLAFATRQGLGHGINYAATDFEAEVRRLTGGRGVDVAFDAVGGENYAKSYRCLAPGGRMLCFGMADLMPAGWASLARTFWKYLTTRRYHPGELIDRSVGVFGYQMLSFWDELETVGGEMDALLGMVRSGQIRPVVDQIFDLADAAKAHRYLQSRRSMGKVLLRASAE